MSSPPTHQKKEKNFADAYKNTEWPTLISLECGFLKDVLTIGKTNNIMTRLKRMYEQIENHGNNLLAIFPNAKEQDPVKLSKKLLRLENKAHILTTDECNTGESHYAELCKILTSVRNLLQHEFTGEIFVNGDARGYALKIKDDYIRENNVKIQTDWGGYGILAPEFNGQ